jgi:iduronate 2-sulfatase
MRILSFLLASTAALLAADAPRPNVLLICVDDLKPVIRCYGDTTAITPNVDRLAAKGLRFESAYTNQAVCSPSRNALIAGLRPQTLGIYDLPTHFRKAAPDTITLPQHFLQNGYHTEAMGKILHTGHGNIEDAAAWSIKPWKPKAPGYAKKQNLVSNPNGDRGLSTESADVKDDFYGDGQLALHAAKRLHELKDKGPFFLGVGFIKPHLPFVAPQKYWQLYDPAKLPMPEVTSYPEGAPSYAPQAGGELRQYADMQKKKVISLDDTRHLIHGYYAATSYMDAQLGLVLDALEKEGLEKNTIIVLWGDHGWHLGDHGMWCKHTNYEQATRIPFIVAGPGIAAGQSTQSMVESVDVYPTLAELAGLPKRSGLDGQSFAATLRDPSAPARSSVTHVYPRNNLLGRAIRTPRYRYVEWKKPGSPTATAEHELYDYEADPLERKNLAKDKPEIVKELAAILAQQPEAKPQLGQGKSLSEADQKKRVDAFIKRDTSKDGKLTLQEFMLHQPDGPEAAKRFPLFDANQDGSLSQDEYVFSGGVNR